MIDLRDMKNFKRKANFTFGNASNLKALDIPGIVANRFRKKHVDTERPSYRNRKSRDKSQVQAQND